MGDHIDELIKSYRLNKYCEKNICEKTVLHLSNAWEQIAGKDVKPPIEIIKKLLEIMIYSTPEWLQVIAKEKPEIERMISERLCTKIIEVGYYEADANRRVSYVS